MGLSNFNNSSSSTQLDLINFKLDLLLSNSGSNENLAFNLLTLSPTYQTYASSGWATSPQSLQALYDNDLATASNLFQINGAAWGWGDIILSPGISIPQFTRINFKVGLQNSAGSASLFELATFNVALSSYVNCWSYYGNVSSSQDLIVNIDTSINHQWDKLRFKMWDTGQYSPRARFYDLKVWSVGCS